MANKFEKIRVIGSGSFGQAWLVCSKHSRRKYVVKEMQVGNMTEKERNQAVNEVSILARLKHQHVIRYRQAYVNSGMLCIAMEYADGGDMGAIIYEAASLKSLLAEHRILNWFVQICLALQYIHALNILHRDLKPQNIFVTSDDIVKVGDFGIARILSNSDDHANTAIGTPYYLSPEICCRKSYNQKSDMWAAGCILYELATLIHPFNATDFSLLVVKILSAKYKPLNRVYGPFLHDLVSVLLSVNPNGRPSAEQILQIPAIKPYLGKDMDCNIPAIHRPNTNSSPNINSRRTRRRQTLSVVSRETSGSAVKKDQLNSLSLRINEPSESSRISQKHTGLHRQSGLKHCSNTTFRPVDEAKEGVRYPVTPKPTTTDSDTQPSRVYSCKQLTTDRRKGTLVFNNLGETKRDANDSHISSSPEVKIYVDMTTETSPNDLGSESNLSVSEVDPVDVQISTSRNRKYSVNKSGVHLGVTRGCRSDSNRTPTTSRGTSYFKKDDVMMYGEHPSYIGDVDHAIPTSVNEMSSCSMVSVANCSKKYSTNREYLKGQASECVSDQCLTPSKEFNSKYKRKSHLHISLKVDSTSLASSGSVKKHKPLSGDLTEPRNGQTPAKRSPWALPHTPDTSYEQKRTFNVRKVHNGELTLADLMPNDNRCEDVDPRSHINSHDGSSSNVAPSESGKRTTERRCDLRNHIDDEEPSIYRGIARNPEANDNHTIGNSNVGLEQMYFWARNLAHRDRVNVASVETLRAFLELRVSLLKLKAIRAILKDGDLQDDESLTLIIKEVLGDQMNVLPLILELHFMESKIC